VVGGEGDSDRELVEGVRDGDATAFSALYARHLDAVRKEIRRASDDAPVVDMAQDVFVRALEALPSLREPALFRPWLLSIARRAAIDQRRARRHEQPLDDAVADELSDGAHQPHDVAELRELAGLVRGMVAGLSRRDATAVRLIVDLGFSPDELALALGVTPGAARVVLHRARRRLRDALVLELLVRRQITGCAQFARLDVENDVVAAGLHVRRCEACRESARREVVGHDLRVQAGHSDVRSS
jgi:RNA polymerase sigma-70 factor (ECF subfamily)